MKFLLPSAVLCGCSPPSAFALALLLWFGVHSAAHALGPIELIPFDDDLKSEEMAILNAEFSAAYPAGDRVTRALAEVLRERGLEAPSGSGAALTLSGTVTEAYVMSRGMPTNSVAARYRLTESATGQVVAQGDMTGSDWNNEDAAQRLAEAIVKAVSR